MTDPIDTLRPEVREAVAAIDGGNGVFVNADDCIGSEKWKIVRDELLRLAHDNNALRAEVERLRNEERVERCESGDPACGPVEFHDSEGVPLCKACWDALIAENGAHAQQPAERGEG